MITLLTKNEQSVNILAMTLFEYSLSAQRKDFYDVTPQVRDAVAKSGVANGIAVVYCPHTTAGITINENADPDVIHDLLIGLDKAFPDRSEFRHAEGNSTAHLKSSAVGSSVTVIIEGGKLLLGTWQSVFFCEFDPPRNRKFYVKVLDG
jgi:secondary thiamine-phosphate synthase enzyme